VDLFEKSASQSIHQYSMAQEPASKQSEHVWFANDQLAVRFIEEIDFDYAATDATAALITAAS